MTDSEFTFLGQNAEKITAVIGIILLPGLVIWISVINMILCSKSLMIRLSRTNLHSVLTQLNPKLQL